MCYEPGSATAARPAAAEELTASGAVRLAGDSTALTDPAAILDDFDPAFPIVTP
ncbi:alkyl sulfatase C-terminal domain-containing protein [Nocardia sp. NPDC003963]